ncbi:MAG: phosphoribosylamine--glycine ligase [Chloroflexi bacterium]|nr:phosphoribosylamine--glycine ligase [Chloroflexota bacterium]
MKVLVVGSGAREHALAWKLAQSPRVNELFIAPGNAGTARLGHNLDISPTDIDALVKAARQNRVDFTVVGPEAPLAAGLCDHFLIRGMPIFGATRQAAQIESSKAFARDLMQRWGIPCAPGAVFSDHEQAREYILKQRPPIVIKADGLAAGKGVTVAGTTGEALAALSSIMEKKSLGAAGDRVVIEECLAGREMSAFAFADAHHAAPMPPACDYKRAYDGGAGPNTGGMGSYSPPHFASQELLAEVNETILAAAVHAMHEDGRPYKSVLYAGLMITAEGPRVLEFNARFGDPEAQVILPRLKTDLVDIMVAIFDNRLHQVDIEWSDEACAGVVMASGGYPDTYKTGFPITGLDGLDSDVMVFHAGTRADSGRTVTAGGRVLTLVALDSDVSGARDKVYANIDRIKFEGCYYRKDIAKID